MTSKRLRIYAFVFSLVFVLAVGFWQHSSSPAARDDGEGAGSIPDIRLRDAFPTLTFERPIWMVQAPGDAGHYFVVEQAGRIYKIARDAKSAQKTLFLDLSKRTLSYANGGDNEEGLLCLAFDPDYEQNRT